MISPDYLESSYELIDSGAGMKLERFGERRIARPSSMCVWKQRLPSGRWTGCDATFEAQRGWRFANEPFSAWEMPFDRFKLKLELQTNGQIGVFPEHALYLPKLREEVKRLAVTRSPVRMLNLFAYTGLATLAAASCGTPVEITHVDLAKRALDWTKENIRLSGHDNVNVRLIPEDALTFMSREAKRGNRYDVVVIDPPSFSRLSKKDSWTLEEKLPEIVALCLSVLEQKRCALFLTNHSSVNTVDIARNLALDHFPAESITIESSLLHLQEKDTKRLLPAGAVIFLSTD